MAAAEERRLALIRWMRERFPTHSGLTASQIVDVSGIYDTGQGRYDRCFDDLLVLAKHNVVQRGLGRPATWRIHV
jgi:hypothetical protein